MRAVFVSALALLASVVTPITASAHILPDLSIDQLTRRAAVIVEGDVTDVTSAWTPSRDRIYTTVTVRVSQVHKGALGGSTLNLRLLGGTVGDVTMSIVGQPGFEPDERVFLFLAPNFERREVPFVGSEEGKLRIAAGATGDVLLGPHQTFEKSDAVSEIRRVMQAIGQ